MDENGVFQICSNFVKFKFNDHEFKMVSLCNFPTIGLEDLNEMNILEDPLCKN